MTVLVLNEEQTEIVRRAEGPVELRDASGRVLTRIEPSHDGGHGRNGAGTEVDIPNEAELIAAALRARGSNQPTYTSEQVQAHLRALEEAAGRGASDDELRAFSKRLLDEAAAR